MCGRFTNLITWKELVRLYRINDPNQPQFNFRPNYNAAPTQTLPIVRINDAGQRQVAMMRWGLIPSWSKDAKIAYSTINARAGDRHHNRGWWPGHRLLWGRCLAR